MDLFLAFSVLPFNIYLTYRHFMIILFLPSTFLFYMGVFYCTIRSSLNVYPVSIFSTWIFFCQLRSSLLETVALYHTWNFFHHLCSSLLYWPSFTNFLLSFCGSFSVVSSSLTFLVNSDRSSDGHFVSLCCSLPTWVCYIHLALFFKHFLNPPEWIHETRPQPEPCCWLLLLFPPFWLSSNPCCTA